MPIAPRRLAPLAAAGLAAAGLPALAAVPSYATSPDIVLSAVYGGGGNSGATYKNDFIELFNRGTTPVSVDGWSVQYAASAGTTWQVTQLSGTIAPGSYYLVQEAAGAGGTTDLPAPDATGSIAMSATSGKVALRTTTAACTGTCVGDGANRDFVGYGSANAYEGSGAAPGLSNTTSDSRRDGGQRDTDDNATDFVEGAPDPRSSTSGGGEEPEPVELSIAEIQGEGHLSPYDGDAVRDVHGVVTAVSRNGFWFEDTTPDNSVGTAEGLFVFTRTAPAVAVGDAVSVGGRVTEFRPGGSSGDNLTTTELTDPTVTVASTGNPLPGPTLVGSGGRVPPSRVIDDDATGSVETSGSFDPTTDGIDFYESMEGMRLRVANPIAVGPTNNFGEIPVVDAATSGPRTARGGIVLRPEDPNPERVILDDLLTDVPAVDVGATFSSPVIGVLDYSFGNFKLLVSQPLTAQPSALPREVSEPAGQDELAIGTFNVENLDPTDPQEKFDRLADVVVNHLRSPAILALEEVQDNNGATNDAVVAADETYRRLIAAISAAGGPAYESRQIDPVDDQDGGQPGGNIRVGFLFQPGRGLSLAEALAGDATTAVQVVRSGPHPHLSVNPGRIQPMDAAFEDSRKPLAAEFKFKGRTVFVVATHFNSKGGDEPLFGRWQPPARPSEEQRVAQARIVNDFVEELLAVDPAAHIAVVGDINDFPWSDAVRTLAGDELVDLPATLPVPEQYTYVFDGNSQVLDHVLLSCSLAALPFEYDIVHVSAEYADQVSDHDPQVVRLPVKERRGWPVSCSQ